MTEKIRAQLIMEVLGKPREHVHETIVEIRKEIEKEKDAVLISHSIGEPREIKDSKEFFTGFLDVEIEVEKVEALLAMTFKYMPAHIDLIYPERIQFANVEIAEMLNFLIAKLHGYDEIARILQFENEKLGKELQTFREKEKK